MAVLADPWSIAADIFDPPSWEPPSGDWEPWLRQHAAAYCTNSFAEHHRRIWQWVWELTPGVSPTPLVAVIGRGGAKSTTAEMACAVIGARQARRYGLYICETQDQANDHLNNVGAILESKAIEQAYPLLAERRVGKYGNSKGWNVTRLRTASGFTIDAVGLDTAARGVKLEDARPDFMVIDDVDGETDSPDVTRRKIKTLTRALIPAGSNDLAVLAIQNLVHEHSIFARMLPGYPEPADFLAGRILVGPVPAVRDLVYEQQHGRFVITGGTPSWDGQDLAACQVFIDKWGLSSFLSEAQHEVEPPPGGMFDHIEFQHVRFDDVPWERVVRRSVWVDPAVTDNDGSDAQGIQADVLAADGTIYRVWSWEAQSSPLNALCRAIRKADELGSGTVGVETDQGGDTWESVYREAVRSVREGSDGLGIAKGLEWTPPAFTWDKAGAGKGPKAHRASQMLVDYERGRFVHVEGTHKILERALRRFPKTKPFDLVDAAYWAWRWLTPGTASSYLAQLAPACPTCGQPNLADAPSCSKCGGVLAS